MGSRKKRLQAIEPERQFPEWDFPGDLKRQGRMSGKNDQTRNDARQRSDTPAPAEKTEQARSWRPMSRETIAAIDIRPDGARFDIMVVKTVYSLPLTNPAGRSERLFFRPFCKRR